MAFTIMKYEISKKRTCYLQNGIPPRLGTEISDKILSYIPELYPNIEVVKLSIQEDHVHMVVVIPPRIVVSNAIQYIKIQSAKKLKAKFPFMQKIYTRKGGIWSRGYCVSCIGLNEKEILAYVEHQEKEDKGQLTLL